MCTIKGGGVVDSLLSFGIGTLLKMIFCIGCVFSMVIDIGEVDDKDSGLSLSEPLEEGDDGKDEEDSDWMLSL